MGGLKTETWSSSAPSQDARLWEDLQTAGYLTCVNNQDVDVMGPDEFDRPTAPRCGATSTASHRGCSSGFRSRFQSTENHFDASDSVFSDSVPVANAKPSSPPAPSGKDEQADSGPNTELRLSRAGRRRTALAQDCPSRSPIACRRGRRGLSSPNSAES
ncbi:hypothetical protein C2E23DRAFT_893589 [Lenzites betulinus]|nr:hypothetical protein C2E23DRAFT_893589 [Lenzites betulinus]